MIEAKKESFMSKKILFVSPTGTLDNGAEISITHLMKELVKHGHQVYNIVPQLDLAKQQSYIDYCEKNQIKLFATPVVKWWWSEAPGGTTGTAEERNYSYRRNITQIREIIQVHQIDLVISNTVNVFQGAVAASCEGVAHYWLIHEFPEGEFAYYKEKLSFIDQFSERIFAVAGSLTEALQRELPHRKIESFAPYTHIEYTKLQEAKNSRIVSIGRLTERKNQLELLEAYHQLTEKMNDLELVFIGGWDPKYKKQCDDYIKENNLTNVTFTNNVDNPWDYVTDKDICVLPSSMETFGLVYIEAVLNQVPVIISDNLGHKSAYELVHAGIVYPLGNIAKLVEKIDDLYQNYAAQKKMAMQFAENARKVYTIEQLSKALIQAIDEKVEITNNYLVAIAPLLENSRITTALSVNNRFYRFFIRFKNWLRRRA